MRAVFPRFRFFRRLEASLWIFVVEGLLGVLFFDGMLLLLQVLVAWYSGEPIIRSQYAAYAAW